MANRVLETNACSHEETFNLFDHAAKGGINIRDLQRVSKECGVALTESDYEIMVKLGGPKMEISYSDWVQMHSRRMNPPQ